MNLFIVGDVHGCYHTFKSMVKSAWNPEDEILIQVGDLINKGAHSHKTLRYVFELQKKYPTRAVFLKGNHEWFLYNYLSKYDGSSSVKPPFEQNIKPEKLGLSRLDLKQWILQLPLFWENNSVLISHAGIINEKFLLPEYQSDKDGLLHNRKKIKALPQVQVLGHVVQNNMAAFSTKENCWRIDTGAWLGKHLTGLRLSYTGNLIEIIKQPTDPRDLKTGKASSNWLPIMELYSDF